MERLAELYGRKPVFFCWSGLVFVASTLCVLPGVMLPLGLFLALQGSGPSAAGRHHPIASLIIGDIYTFSPTCRVPGLQLSGVFGFAAIIAPMPWRFLVEACY